MAGRKKQEIITFKADASLADAMRGIPNRSEFIRSAILASLQGICPLCRGTGMLSLDQFRHWSSLAGNHALVECSQCHAMHIRCNAEGGREEVHGR